MADKTVNQQNEDTNPTSDDFVLTWDTASGTTKKVTMSSFKNSVILSNPYKFSAYRNAALTDSNGSVGVVAFDAELFDTNNNFDITTNKGRYTVPVNGFYHFNSSVLATLNNGGYGVTSIMKNGTEFKRGEQIQATGAGPYSTSVSDTVQLVAGDYIEIGHQGVGNAVNVGTTPYSTWFTGFLVSLT